MQSCSEHMCALVHLSVLPLQTSSGHSKTSFIQRQQFQTYWVHTHIRKTVEDSRGKNLLPYMEEKYTINPSHLR